MYVPGGTNASQKTLLCCGCGVEIVRNLQGTAAEISSIRADVFPFCWSSRAQYGCNEGQVGLEKFRGYRCSSVLLLICSIVARKLLAKTRPKSAL
jgi:hypothetical protein